MIEKTDKDLWKCPKCPKCGNGEILLCSYQVGNVNEKVVSVKINKDNDVTDFSVNNYDGDIYNPIFECQCCNVELNWFEICA